MAGHSPSVGNAAAREEAYFGGARFDDDELRDAAEENRRRRAGERARHAEATASNLGLGHDIRAALADPSHDQLSALREIVCRLLCEHHPEPIADGAGWTDAERQQPVGDTGRREPRHVDTILDAELQRALEDPDSLHGLVQLVARWGAAFFLDPDGVTRTKALGSERWRASCAPPSPAANIPWAPRSGPSCARSSPRGWCSSPRTPSLRRRQRVQRRSRRPPRRLRARRA